MAMNTAALDEITNQRFILGLGVAGPEVQSMHGVPFRKPLARMRDYVNIIKQALEGKKVSYNGDAYTIDDFTLGFLPKQPHAPIYIAALRPKMAELAGEVADGVLFDLATPDYVEEVLAHLKVGARRTGRDPAQVEIGCFIRTYSSTDSDAAAAAARRGIVGLSYAPAYQSMLRNSGFSKEMNSIIRALDDGDEKKASSAVSDRMVESLVLVGDSSQWDKKVQKYRDAGVDQHIIFPTAVGPDTMASFRLAVGAF